jgi:hypothetical protein
MEWVNIKPMYHKGRMKPSSAQNVYSWLTKAGFQLEQQKRNVSPATVEYFYFHPSLYIHVHEVQEPDNGLSRFFIFYPGGATAFAPDIRQLQRCIPAG